MTASDRGPHQVRRGVAEERAREYADREQVSVGELAKQYAVRQRQPDPRYAEQGEGDRARLVGLTRASQRERRGDGRQEDGHHRRHAAVQRGRRQRRCCRHTGQCHAAARPGEAVELERRAGRQEREGEREHQTALEHDQHRRRCGRDSH